MIPLVALLLGGCAPPAPVPLGIPLPPATGAVHLPLQRFVWAGPNLPEDLKAGHALCTFATKGELPLSTLKRALDDGWLQLGLVEVAGERVRLGGADLAALPSPESMARSQPVIAELEARLQAALQGTERLNAACGAHLEPQVLLAAPPEAMSGDGFAPIYTAGKVGLHDIWLLVDQPGAPEWRPPRAWTGAPQEYMTLFEDSSGVRLLSARRDVAPLGPVKRELTGGLLGGGPQGPQVCLTVATRPEVRWADTVGLIDVAHRAGGRDLLPALSGPAVTAPLSRPQPSPGPALDWSAGVSALPLSLPYYNDQSPAPTVTSSSGACVVNLSASLVTESGDGGESTDLH